MFTSSIFPFRTFALVMSDLERLPFLGRKNSLMSVFMALEAFSFFPLETPPPPAERLISLSLSWPGEALGRT